MFTHLDSVTSFSLPASHRKLNQAAPPAANARDVRRMKYVDQPEFLGERGPRGEAHRSWVSMLIMTDLFCFHRILSCSVFLSF